MKRSSSPLDQQVTNYNDKLSQTSDAKVARRSSSQSRINHEEKTHYHQQEISCTDQSVSDKPRHSIILGSFSNPPIYVIHYLDSYLTFYQSFQICSLFGRIRIHGYNLSPCKFCSIFNYRINNPLTMEYISSTITIKKTLEDIKLVIPDQQLAELTFFNIQEKGGDILLIRKESNNDSLFIKTIREHQFYKHWFGENYNLFEENSWKQLEKNLYIRFIETTNETVIIPHEQFVLTADHIITRWLNETTEDFPFVVLISGEKDMGKSTFTRYLINRSLNHITSTYNLTYFDCDIGQCEFTIGGCLSYVDLNSPLLGPPCSHIKSNPKPDRLLYYGLVSPQTAPIRYLQYIDKLRQLWNDDHKNQDSKRSIILINTMGWGTGLGLELLKETICMCVPNVIIQLSNNINSSQDQNKMPDLTLQWLLQQPVFIPYRHKIQMNNKRTEDYDGQLNYEYIKLQSAASNITHIETHKLRPRDHRLFATWSYFFSSNLTCIHLPWSQFIHVSLLNKDFDRLLPDCLQHSIIGFCSNENIDQWRNSANNINGILHLSDTQNEIFECLGFGWIEYCNKETQTYEIFTPLTCLSNINILISGTFDTPDEFEYMFKRILTE